MYYRYEIVGENIYKLCDKSNTPLDGERVVTCDEDIDLQLFDVTVGFIHNGVMIRHTKKLKSTEAVARRLTEIDHLQTELGLKTEEILRLNGEVDALSNAIVLISMQQLF